MSRKSRRKKGGTLDDLETEKGQNMLMGFLQKNKTPVLIILVFFVLLIVDIILTFLMAFGIM